MRPLPLAAATSRRAQVPQTRQQQRRRRPWRLLLWAPRARGQRQACDGGSIDVQGPCVACFLSLTVLQRQQKQQWETTAFDLSIFWNGGTAEYREGLRDHRCIFILERSARPSVRRREENASRVVDAVFLGFFNLASRHGEFACVGRLRTPIPSVAAAGWPNYLVYLM
jgi:hypothetical protein